MLSRLFIVALWSLAGKELSSWLLLVMFIVFFFTFPCGILSQVWHLIVSFPDLCPLSYFVNLFKLKMDKTLNYIRFDHSQRLLLMQNWYIKEYVVCLGYCPHLKIINTYSFWSQHFLHWFIVQATHIRSQGAIIGPYKSWWEQTRGRGPSTRW